MPRRQSDRDLRRLVADLATTGQADVEAILETLEPDQRRTVATLLEDYLGRRERPKPPPQPPRRTPPEALAPRIPGLSPWLALRLRQSLTDPAAPRRALGRPAVVAAITPAALETLRSCAATLAPPATPARATWLRGVAGLLAPRRASP